MIGLRTLVSYLTGIGRKLSPCARALMARLVTRVIVVIGHVPWIGRGMHRPEHGPRFAAVDTGRRPDPPPFAELRELDGFECVEVAADFGKEHYPLLATVLQCGPRGKLLDLRGVRGIRPDLFAELARAWRVTSDMVPRLGILVAYDTWAIFRDVALRQLEPISARGISIEMFYEQQAELSRWFACGERAPHDPAAVVLWLATEWSAATAVWPAILNATARLVDAEAGVSAPQLLIDLGAIALSVNADDARAHASTHFYAALAKLGDRPSSARARALRLLAMAQRVSDPPFARALLDKAVSTAEVAKDRVEGAHALAHLAILAREGGQPWRAARRLRDALILLRSDEAPQLRSFLHHELMIALHQQSQLRMARTASALHQVPVRHGTCTAEES